MSEKKTVFLICPVRGIIEEEKKYLEGFINGWETPGYKLHYPPRDTNQNDPTGLNICRENRAAIIKSESVILYYNPTSTGTYFDIGMTFAARKPLFTLNAGALDKEELSPLERFINVYSDNDFGEVETLNDYPYILNREERRDEIKRSLLVPYEWKDKDPEFLFDFGMAFMLEKTIVLNNRTYVESQRTPHKSFQNVLLELDKRA